MPYLSRPFVCGVALILLMLSFGSAIHAQDTVTGAFEGTVSNSQTGAEIKGALVQIINEQTGLTVDLRSDYRGRFYQGLLIPGVYRIRVSSPGYETQEVRQRLKITYTGEVVPVPVALDPAGAVVAVPPPLAAAADTDIRASIIRLDGRRSGSFTEDQIVNIPLGRVTTVRSFDELALLLPGVALPPQTLGRATGPGVGAGVGSAGQFSANGLRSRANNFTVDGSDNNDEDIGVRRQGFVALIPQSIESIQEYQVITLLAPAQFGRNLGAQVNAVSKSGGNKTHGTIYGTFNSSQLNARSFFDTTLGNAITNVRANDQDVVVQTRNLAGAVLSQQPLTVTNQSGGKDSFSFGQFGFVLGGPMRKDRTFYFVSFEEEITNATSEESFAVPTVGQRGAFGTGATGIFRDPFTNAPTSFFPTSINGSAIFSLFPFANNPNGIYGANTFTQVLPASARGSVFSGKIDDNFKISGKEQSVTGRYNFTNDWREIPVTGGALFSTLKPQIRTQNFSFFLNSKLSAADSRSVFNQLRLSYGRTRLRFDEVRDTQFQVPSVAFPQAPFLLNSAEFVNMTAPAAVGIANAGPVIYVRQPITVEQEIGSIGQVVVGGFSPLGVDVFNFPQRRVNNTYQLADQLTLRGGNHSFTFGTDNRRSELNSELPRNNRSLVTFNGSPRLIFDPNGVPRFPTANDPNPIIRAVDLAAIDAPNNLFLTLSTGGPDEIGLRFYQLNFFAQDEMRLGRNLSLSFGLRYEYNTPAREVHSLVEDTFSSPLLNLAPGLRGFVDGRTKIFDPDRNNFAPRVGIAYSVHPFGERRVTVLRGGYGVFYDQILGAVVSQSRNVFPSFFTLNFGGGPSTSINNQTLLELFNPANTTFGNLVIPLVAPGTLNRLNPQLNVQTLLPDLLAFFPGAISPTLPARRLEMPSSQHYAFTVEQQLSKDLVFSAAYVGTSGRHLLRFTTPNLGPALNLVPTDLINVGIPNVPGFLGRVSSPARPVTGLGGINRFETIGSSRYDSLQLQLRGRLQRSLQYQVAYTLSKASDDVSDVFDLAGAFGLPQNSLTFAGEWGPANFDARHRLAYNLNYQFPTNYKSKVARTIFKGIEIASTGRFQTGQSFTVNTNIDINQDGNLTDRLDTTNGIAMTGNRRQPLALTTTNTLSLLAPFGQDGQVGRNTFRAGSILELDLSVLKNMRLTSRQTLTLKADIFNFPNRANFGIPVRVLEAPSFGQATNTVTPGRRIQLSLKYSF